MLRLLILLLVALTVTVNADEVLQKENFLKYGDHSFFCRNVCVNTPLDETTRCIIHCAQGISMWIKFNAGKHDADNYIAIIALALIFICILWGITGWFAYQVFQDRKRVSRVSK